MKISEKDWENAIKKANDKIELLSRSCTNRQLIMPIINNIHAYGYGNRTLKLYEKLMQDL